MSDVVCVLVFFFFKQKTAYEMRISDWSSDVCSSDLRQIVRTCAQQCGRRVRLRAERRAAHQHPERLEWRPAGPAVSGDHPRQGLQAGPPRAQQIGRASGRERVGRYVEISVAAVSFKKKHNINYYTALDTTSNK